LQDFFVASNGKGSKEGINWYKYEIRREARLEISFKNGETCHHFPWRSLFHCNNSDLEIISNVIETNVCQIWADDYADRDDRSAARLPELMIDKYSFNGAVLRTDTAAAIESVSVSLPGFFHTSER